MLLLVSDLGEMLSLLMPTIQCLLLLFLLHLSLWLLLDLCSTNLLHPSHLLCLLCKLPLSTPAQSSMPPHWSTLLLFLYTEPPCLLYPSPLPPLWQQLHLPPFLLYL